MKYDAPEEAVVFLREIFLCRNYVNLITSRLTWIPFRRELAKTAVSRGVGD